MKNFGAAGNGKKDDTKAIQSAINFAASKQNKSTVYFPAGIYLVRDITTSSTYLENYFLLLKSHIKIEGDGKKTSIKIADNLFNRPEKNANAHLFKGQNIVDLVVQNICIDLNGKNNLVPEGSNKNAMAFLVFQGSDIRMDHVSIINCAGQNMISMRAPGSKLSVEDCEFRNGGHYVGSKIENKYQADFSFLYSEWSETKIQDNIFVQEDVNMALKGFTGGVEIHASDSEIKKNRFTGCFPAVYLASTNGILKNIHVDSNTMSKCVKGISFWCVDSIKNITISYNDITLTNAGNSAVISVGIEVPNGNTTIVSKENANNAPIINLLIKSNNISSLLPSATTYRSIGMHLHSLHNSLVEDNIISNFNLASISVSGSKWGMNNSLFLKNILRNNQPNTDEKAVAAHITVTDTYSSDIRDAPGFTNLQFEQNQITGTENFRAAPGNARNFLGVFVAVPEKVLKGVTLRENELKGSLKEKQLTIKTPLNY
ncbi:MAG: glycosyl hydrolase family 28-related protein [Bacteroidota bacterium]